MDGHTVCVAHIRIFRRLTDYPVQSISCPVCWKLPLLGCIYLTAIWYCQTGSYMSSLHPSQSMRVHMKITILSFTRPHVFPTLYDLLSPIVKNALVIVLLKWYNLCANTASRLKLYESLTKISQQNCWVGEMNLRTQAVWFVNESFKMFLWTGSLREWFRRMIQKNN